MSELEQLRAEFALMAEVYEEASREGIPEPIRVTLIASAIAIRHILAGGSVFDEVIADQVRGIR